MSGPATRSPKRQRPDVDAPPPPQPQDFLDALTTITTRIADNNNTDDAGVAHAIIADLDGFLQRYPLVAVADSIVLLDDPDCVAALAQHAFRFGRRTPLSDAVFARTGLLAYQVLASVALPHLLQTLPCLALLEDVSSSSTNPELAEAAITLLGHIAIDALEALLLEVPVVHIVAAIDAYLCAVIAADNVTKRTARNVADVIDAVLHSLQQQHIVDLCNSVTASATLTAGFARLIHVQDPTSDDLLLCLANICLVVAPTCDLAFPTHLVPLMLPHMAQHLGDVATQTMPMACFALAASHPAIAGVLGNSAELLAAVVAVVTGTANDVCEVAYVAASIEHLCTASAHARAEFGKPRVIKALCRAVCACSSSKYSQLLLSGLYGITLYCRNTDTFKQYAPLIINTCLKALACADAPTPAEALCSHKFMTYNARSLVATAVLTLHMARTAGSRIGVATIDVLARAYCMVSAAIDEHACGAASNPLLPGLVPVHRVFVPSPAPPIPDAVCAEVAAHNALDMMCGPTPQLMALPLMIDNAPAAYTTRRCDLCGVVADGEKCVMLTCGPCSAPEHHVYHAVCLRYRVDGGHKTCLCGQHIATALLRTVLPNRATARFEPALPSPPGSGSVATDGGGPSSEPVPAPSAR